MNTSDAEDHDHDHDQAHDDDQDQANDDQLARLCDALVADFFGASALITTAIASPRELPTSVVDLLLEILRQADSWLPSDTSDQLETELIPHVVQLLLDKSPDTAAMDNESVASVRDLLLLVLEKTASRLLRCDACLLPSLVRILDDRRPFYENEPPDLDDDDGSSNSNKTGRRFVDGNAVQRNGRSWSALYEEQIAHWGEIGGFSLLLRCLQATSSLADANADNENEDQEEENEQSESQHAAIETNRSPVEPLFELAVVQCIYRLLYAIKDHVASRFLAQYVGPLAQSSRVYMKNLSDADFARHPRDAMLEIVQIVELLVDHAAVTAGRDQEDAEEEEEEEEEEGTRLDEAQRCVQLLRMDVMLRLLVSPSLEKRIYGMVEILDVLSSVISPSVSQQQSSTTADHLATWLSDNSVMELMFGEKKHPELIKRCGPLVRFVWRPTRSPTTADTEQWMDAMWTCFAGTSTGSQIHEVIRTSVHALLLDVITFADSASLAHLMELIQSARRALDVEILSLLSALATQTNHAVADTSGRLPVLVARFLWESTTSQAHSAPNPVAADADVIDDAIEEIVSILNNHDDNGDLVDEFLGLCLDMLERHNHRDPASEPPEQVVVVALRLVDKLATLVVARSSDDEDESQLTGHIASQLVPAILSELGHYKASHPLEEDEDEAQDDQVQAADVAYLHGVRERLLALRSVLLITHTTHVEATVPTCSLLMGTLWRLCVDEARQGGESSLFFQWIEYCFKTRLPAPQGRLVTLADAEELLLTKFSVLAPTQISLSALCCFHHLFRTLNVARGGLVTCTSNGQPVGGTSQGDADDEPENDDQQQHEQAQSQHQDLLTGEPLVGVDVLWHLALHAVEQHVAEEAMTVLARYHLDFVLELRDGELARAKKTEFVDKCMTRLTTDHAGDRGSDGDAASVVNRCLDCLRYFVDATTCDKTSAETETETEKTKTSIKETAKHLRLDGLALGDLEHKLESLEIYPSPMKELVATTTSGASLGRRPSWTFKQHHAVLEAIQDDDDGDDGDGEQDEDQGGTRRAMLRRGSRSASGASGLDYRRLSVDTSIVEAFMSRPTQLTTSPSVRARPDLQWISHTTQSTMREGPAFVIDTTVSSSNSSLTWGQEQSQGEQYQSTSVAQLLVNRKGLMATLFDLVQSGNEDKETSTRAWGLLCQLPVSDDLLRRMLRLRLPPAEETETETQRVVVDWSDLLPSRGCGYRLLYALRLVEALLLQETTGETHSVKRQWRERFARLGGVTHLVATGQSLLDVPLANEPAAPTATTPHVAATCLASIARILTYFATTGTTVNQRQSTVSSTSPFDARLVATTLPDLFASQLPSMVTLAVALSVRRDATQYNPPPTPEPAERALENAEGLDASPTTTTLCGIQLLCSLALLDASVVLTALNEQPLTTWLQSVLGATTSSTMSRRHVVRHFSNLQSSLCHLSKSGDGTRLLEQLLQSALEMAFVAVAAPPTQPQHADDQELLTLITNLAPLVATSPSLADWIIHNAIVPSLLIQIDELIRHSSFSSLCGYLHVLAALTRQESPCLRAAVLAFTPPSNSNSEAAGGRVVSHATTTSTPWILDVLATKLLWGTDSSSTASHDPATRQAAYDVVLQLAVVDDDDASPSTSAPMVGVLHSLVSFHRDVAAQLTTMGRPWQFAPREELQTGRATGSADIPSSCALAGLVNPGCVCYMNSLLQQLFRMPSFRNGLIQVDTSATAAAAANDAMDSPWAAEVKNLQKLFIQMACSSRKTQDPTEFALSHVDLDGQPTDLHLQMDADEFFCLLLDRLETFVKTTSSPSLPSSASFLDQCFGGVLVNQIVTEHGHLSEREEKFFALSLDVSQKQHLSASLQLYVQGETLDGDNAYYCDTAKAKVSATKRACIKVLPQTLVCHLKRFEFDFTTMEKTKIHDYLAFPDEIDMFPYTSDAFSGKSVGNGGNAKGKSILYDLVGVVVHAGTSDTGHYYSYIKDRVTTASGGVDEAKWVEFNDQTVRPFDAETMGDECYGGDEVVDKWELQTRSYVPVVVPKRRSAYMLIYEKRLMADEPGKSTGTTTTTSSALDWATTPAEVQKLRNATEDENQQLHRVVDATSGEHNRFLMAMLTAAISHQQHYEKDEDSDNNATAATEKERTRWRTSTSGEDDHLAALKRLGAVGAVDALAAIAACQHVFGLLSLLRPPASRDGQKPSTYGDDETVATGESLLSRVETWLLQSPEEKEARKSTCHQAKRVAFCAWLLSQATATATGTAADGDDGHRLVRRSWVFDLLFLSESPRQALLVQSGCSLLQHALVYLVQHHDDDNDASSTSKIAIAFLQSMVAMFFDRDEIEIHDPVSGSLFPLAQASIIHGVTLIGSFLYDCVAPHRALCDVLVRDSGFLDRLLFSLQAADSSSSSSHGNHGGTASSLTSRVRACTLPLERQLVRDALAAPSSSHLLSSKSCFSSRLVDDPRVLLDQNVLKNLLIYHFDEPLTPLLVHVVCHTMTRTQSDKFVALLLAVLEEVKATYLDQLLAVFTALLDAEEAEDDELQRLDSRGLYKCLLSPTSGLLEAAAYYRDHRTLHEYAFLLVEFAVTRAAASPRIQRYFQANEAMKSQVAWIQDWLGKSLDPQHTMRRSPGSSHVEEEEPQHHGEGQKDHEDADADDPAVLEKEVRRVFRNAELAFGFRMLPPMPSVKPKTVKEDDASGCYDDQDHELLTSSFAIESLEDSDDVACGSSHSGNNSDSENQLIEEEEEEQEAHGWCTNNGSGTGFQTTKFRAEPSQNTLKTHHIRRPELEMEEEEDQWARPIPTTSPTNATFAVGPHMSSAA